MAQSIDLSFVLTLDDDKFVNLQDLSGESSKFFITVNGKYGPAGTDFSCNFWPHTYSSAKIETLKRETHALVDSSFVYASPTAVKDISFEMLFNKGEVKRTGKFTIKQGDKAVSCLPQTYDGSHSLLDLYFYNLMDVTGAVYQRMNVLKLTASVLEENTWGIYKPIYSYNQLTWNEKIHNTKFYKNVYLKGQHGQNIVNHFIITGISGDYFHGPSEFEIYMSGKTQNNIVRYPNASSSGYGRVRFHIIWPKIGRSIDLAHIAGKNTAEGPIRSTSAPSTYSQLADINSIISNDSITYNSAQIYQDSYSNTFWYKIVITSDFKLELWRKSTSDGTYAKFGNSKTISGSASGGGLNNSDIPFFIGVGGEENILVYDLKILSAKTIIKKYNPRYLRVILSQSYALNSIWNKMTQSGTSNNDTLQTYSFSPHPDLLQNVTIDAPSSSNCYFAITDTEPNRIDSTDHEKYRYKGTKDWTTDTTDSTKYRVPSGYSTITHWDYTNSSASSTKTSWWWGNTAKETLISMVSNKQCDFIRVVFEEAVEVKSVHIKINVLVLNRLNLPLSFNIYGSNDNSTWTELFKMPSTGINNWIDSFSPMKGGHQFQSYSYSSSSYSNSITFKIHSSRGIQDLTTTGKYKQYLFIPTSCDTNSKNIADFIFEWHFQKKSEWNSADHNINKNRSA